MGQITVRVTVNEPVEKAWEAYTTPEHIVQWSHASNAWHTPRAVIDLRVGRAFNYRMEAKDGGEGFDFTGTYTDIIPHKKLAYTLDDGRHVTVLFEKMGNSATVTTTFDPEPTNTPEQERAGWQAIMDNFKAYVERI